MKDKISTLDTTIKQVSVEEQERTVTAASLSKRTKFDLKRAIYLHFDVRKNVRGPDSQDWPAKVLAYFDANSASEAVDTWHDDQQENVS